MNTARRGRNFLHVPGPTNIPERVLAAMMRPALDLADPALVDCMISVFADMKKIAKTEDGQTFMYAANGHGAWEAALVNTLQAGDKVLLPETGGFSFMWGAMAQSLGVLCETIPSDWRTGVDPEAIAERLAADKNHEIKAVLMVHIDTATSVQSDIEAVGRVIRQSGHPALYMVDAVASLATTDIRMDEWGIDVLVGGSQKGLMQPPGLSFTLASEKAMVIGDNGGMPRSYWDWRFRRGAEYYRWFCGTGPIHLIFALREGMDMLFEEGMDNVFARHKVLSSAVHAAVEAWSSAGSMEFNASKPEERAVSVTTVRLADAHEGLDLRTLCRETYDVSIGGGLVKLQGKSFRIGHMGYLNTPMILGALTGIELGMTTAGLPFGKGGIDAAMAKLIVED